MFTNVSMTGTGVVVMMIALVLSFFKVQIGTEQLTQAVDAVLYLYSTVTLIWGQLRRPDLKFGLIKKQDSNDSQQG